MACQADRRLSSGWVDELASGLLREARSVSCRPGAEGAPEVADEGVLADLE